MQFEIVDAHHHLLDLELLEYPWIRTHPPALAALSDRYFEIARDYRTGDYLDDVGEQAALTIACESGAADGVAEASWVQRCSNASGFPSAFIGAVDLTDPALPETLARYRDLPVVRALHQPLYWSDDPLRRLGARPDYLTDPAWWRGFERVAGAGLTWDLLVYEEQLPATHDLIRSFPGTRIVLEAAGWPLDQSAEGFARWSERLRAVSRFPNVTLKLQGLALIFGPSADILQRWVGAAVEIFGPDRCMFATHFPVDRLFWPFGDLTSAFGAILQDLSPDQQQALFSTCARRVYGLE
ncbi:MAG: amidohydrolase family protein [Candidatus Dormibacteraceae bacterium]